MTTAHLDRTHEYSAHSGPLSFDDVVYFIEHVKQVEQDDPYMAQGLAYEFADHHLTMSPSDIVMETSAMFDLLARAREVKSLQGTLAQNIVGELGYQFGFADSEYFNALAERVVDQSPEDGIESMVMYRDVLEDASNVTTSGALHATAGLERTFDVILSDRSLPAFSHMVAQALRESLHDVSESPERGVFRTRNDVNGGKFVSAAEQMQLRVESAHLGRKFKSMADGRTTFMARVSSDMVAVTDHSGAPLSLARLSRQAEEQITEKPIDYSVVAKLGLVSDLPVENISPKALLSNVCTAMRAFPEQTKELAPDQIGLSDITTGAFLTAYDEYLATSDAIEQLERRIHSQSEGDCLEATKRVLHDIGGDLGVMQLIRDNERSSEMYEEGLALVFAGNEYGYEMMLTAYDIATTVFRVRQLERDDATSPDWYMRFLRDEHRAIQQRAYEELEQERSLLVRSNEQYTEQLEAYLITAEQNWPEFQDTVARSCANMTEQYETLQFMPIDTIDVTNRDMLQVIHETYVRNQFSESVGFALEELSFDAQDKAVQYMLSADWGTFSRLQKALGERVSTGDKVDLFEAFLATEFGDDFGDKLLSIAEHIPQEELGRVLADLERARMGARGVMDWYRDVDEHFAEMALPAIAERITDMITTLEVAARHKSLRIDVGPGNDPEVESQFIYTATWEQAAKDLHDLADNLESDGWILNDPGTVVSRVVVESDKFARFRLLNSRLGTMVVNIRSYGTLTRGDAQYEVGSFKNGVEAAINMLSNRHDPYGISPTADMRTFSLRFDREGRAPDVAASDRSQRKATNKEGTVAVDVASIWSFGDDNEPATRVGRAIAAGSRLRAEAIGTKDELNHNMLVDQSYGNADVFAELAHKVIAKLDAQAKRTSKKQLATVARTLVQLRDDHQLAA